MFELEEGVKESQYEQNGLKSVTMDRKCQKVCTDEIHQEGSVPKKKNEKKNPHGSICIQYTKKCSYGSNVSKRDHSTKFDKMSP